MHISDLTSALNPFEDEAPKQTHAATAAQPVAPAITLPPQTVAPLPGQAVTDVADHQDDAYQRLLAKSDFASSTVFKTLNKYMAAMAGLDDKTKFNVALKQAQALDGLDPASVSAVFEQCKSALNDAATTFAQSVANKTASDVDAKKKQAEDLQAQAQQLTEDAFAAKQRIDTAQHKFEVALQTRLSEITQEQSKYASLLA